MNNEQKNEEKGFKRIDSKELSSFLTPEPTQTPGLKKRTEAQKKAENDKTRGQTGITTILARQAKYNKDLLLLALTVFFSLFSGVLLGIICVGVAHDEVGVSVLTVFAQLLTLFISLVSAIAKVYTKQGVISQKLCERVEKDPENLDSWGRTIPGDSL